MYAIQADRMLTLTTAANEQRRGWWMRKLQEFERRVRKKYRGFKCVGVLERQKRGALHCHLGVSGWMDVGFLRKVWRRTAGKGNVDMSFKPRSKGNRFTKAALYISKYIGKDVEQARTFGEHRYHRSRGIDRPVERVPIPLSCRASEAQMAFETAVDLLGADIDVWGFNLRVYGYLAANQRQEEYRARDT